MRRLPCIRAATRGPIFIYNPLLTLVGGSFYLKSSEKELAFGCANMQVQPLTSRAMAKAAAAARVPTIAVCSALRTGAMPVN
jgi:hypothetical protein